MPTSTDRASLVGLIHDYLATSGKSAREIGLKFAQDALMVPNLERGQDYPPSVLLALTMRLSQHYSDILADETLWLDMPADSHAVPLAAAPAQ